MLDGCLSWRGSFSGFDVNPGRAYPSRERRGCRNHRRIFSGDVLRHHRACRLAFFYSREDRARFRDMDSSLRENLSMGLADGLDKAIIAGTNGLLTGANLANNAAAAVTDFDGYISELAFARVDGRYASMTGDLRVVMGSGTYAHAGGVYRATESDRTALDRLMDITGGVKVSAHVPAVSNANKQNAVIRRGMARDMVAPVVGAT